MLYGDGDYETLRKRAKKRLSQRNELYGHILTFLVVNGVMWAVWANGLTFDWQTPWPLVVGLMWVSGLLTHIIEVFGKSDGRPAAVNRDVAQQLYLIYGPNWEARADEKTYKKVRKNARSRINARAEFYQHLLSFLPTMALFHILQTTGLTLGLSWSWVPIVGILWLIGLSIHGISTLMTTSEGRILREVEREMSRMEANTPKRKAKRDAPTATLRLGDDAELYDTEADEPALTERKR